MSTLTDSRCYTDSEFQANYPGTPLYNNSTEAWEGGNMHAINDLTHRVSSETPSGGFWSQFLSFIDRLWDGFMEQAEFNYDRGEGNCYCYWDCGM